MQLSILICTIPGRDTAVFNVLSEQAKKYDGFVEVLSLGDNKIMTTGEKRNKLVQMATGKYVVFVDDDDSVTVRYVEAIMEKIMSGDDWDVINFEVSYSYLNERIIPVYYSSEYKRDINLPWAFLRLPNHIMVVKRELALKTPFKDMTFGEDCDFAKRLAPLINKETYIHEPLYFYADGRKISKIHIIALSKADTESRLQVTINFVRSLLSAKSIIDYDITIVESATDAVYPFKIENAVRRLDPPSNPDKFNYNAYMNYAWNELHCFFGGGADITVFCNNDMQFTHGWADELVKYMTKFELDSASPMCRYRYPNNLFQSPLVFGTATGRLVLGHCIAVTKEFYIKCGGFKEDVNFWCSDNVWSRQIEENGGKHALVVNSVANHIGGLVEGMTLRGVSEESYHKLTAEQVMIYNKIYPNHKLQFRS